MRVHRTRQTGYFTKLPNNTARDHQLSFAARGLLTYLLSLPDGAREDVKTLANKSVEGRGAITRALRELETCGYLTRAKVRDGDGRIRTHVEIFADRRAASAPVTPAPVPAGTGEPGGGKAGTKTEDAGLEDSLPPQEPPAKPSPDVRTPGRTGGEPSRSLALLARVGRSEPRLHLAADEAADLAWLVDGWLAKGATPGHVTDALTSGLPARVHRAAALIRHRLTTKMPQEPPRPASRAAWHECGGCDAPMRTAGLCSGCSPSDSEPGRITSPEAGRAWFDLARARLREPRAIGRSAEVCSAQPA